MYTCAPGPYDKTLFRELNEEEVKQFQEHAETSAQPPIEGWWLWHPICREVWERRFPDVFPPRVDN